jgi:hypothetical protein
MRKLFFVSALATIIFFGVETGYSQQRGPCDHLTNPTAKRNCLLRINRDRELEAIAARRRMERLDRIMNRACNMASIADQAAQIAAERPVNPRNPVTVAGVTWTSVRGIMSTLTRERRNCESARQAVEAARR